MTVIETLVIPIIAIRKYEAACGLTPLPFIPCITARLKSPQRHSSSSYALVIFLLL